MFGEVQEISRNDWETIGKIDSFLVGQFGYKIKAPDVLRQIEKISRDHQLNNQTVEELLSMVRGTNEQSWGKQPLLMSALIEEISKRRIKVRN